MKIKLLLILLSLMLCSPLAAQKTYIQAGKFIDVRTNQMRQNLTIVVEDDMILAIEPGYTTGQAEDRIIDLSGYTVMPGLMDMHVHIESQTSPNQFMERMTNNEADIAYNAAGYAEITLMSGFTTVRDLGGVGVNISLKHAIEARKVVGPRIYTAGKL